MPNPQNYDGWVYRYQKYPITLDLLAGAVRDRDAGVDIPAVWITAKPMITPLITMSGKTAKHIPVARPEAIWALKLQAGRDQDITDLFSISDIKVDSNEVRGLFESLTTESLKKKLRKTLSKVDTKKLFLDSMARTGMSSKDHKSVVNWDKFRNVMKSMIPL